MRVKPIADGFLTPSFGYNPAVIAAWDGYGATPTAKHEFRRPCRRNCWMLADRLQYWPRSVVAPIRPSAPRLAERNARIDVTIEASPGRGRHTLTIRCVRAVAGNADTPALDTIGIIRGCRTGAGYRGGTGRRQNQRYQHRVAHEFTSCVLVQPASPQVQTIPSDQGSGRAYSTCTPAALTTFSHFSVSATIIAPKASGVPISGSPPRSIRRALIAGSASTTLIS